MDKSEYNKFLEALKGVSFTNVRNVSNEVFRNLNICVSSVFNLCSVSNHRTVEDQKFLQSFARQMRKEFELRNLKTY